MPDYSKPVTVSLSDLKTRIRFTDLVPSRAGLLEDIDAVFEKLSQRGVCSWMDLQKRIKNPKHLEAFAKEAGIDLQYLVLLRRETEGYHPKPFEVKDIDWVSQEAITKLIENGITSSETLFSRFNQMTLQVEFADEVGIDRETMNDLVNLAELCRVQWVSPVTGRMLIEAGYECCQKLASADADELYGAMDRVNENRKFFKGTIGLRDIKRLIAAAKYFI